MLKLDAKGRVTLPRMIRELLGLDKGSSLYGIADLGKREILLVPLEARAGRLYELRVEMLDIPESVERVRAVLGKLGLLPSYSSCSGLRPFGSLECVFLVRSTDEEKFDPALVKSSLEKLDYVTFVSLRGLEAR